VLVDTHCHLGDPRFDADRDAVLLRAQEAGVSHVIAVADTVPATRAAMALAGAPGVSATAGVHPHHADEWTAEAAAFVADATEDATVVAVGETGLDYHYDHAPRDVQRAAFAAQLALASDHGLPVVVHARDADDDIAAMIREWAGHVPAIVLHSFSAGPTVADAGMEIGAYFSFSGMVTFKNWTMTDVVAACPIDRLMVETDAPYLAPVPHRGKRNEPAFVRCVAERVAELRAVSPDDFFNHTTANARRCFGSRVAGN
jgi:TatD DNase family protein